MPGAHLNRHSTQLWRPPAALALAGALLASAALAQPAQPVPTVSAPVSELLDASPSLTIGNGQIVAHIAPPGPNAFYRGTRFDQAGVITSLKLNGREFYGPWFDRTAPEVLDYAYDANGAIVAGPDSATSGPVEEFAPLGFSPKPGLFIKIGVGVLRQPDTGPYDHYRHYEIVDAGQWAVTPSQSGVIFTQSLKLGETAYTYEKILRLVPGKPQLVIEHRLQNTGSTPINTTAYDHNFLRLTPGNAGTKITFPFPVTIATNPPPSDLIRAEGHTLTYLRAMGPKERVSFLVTGFGVTAPDYDIAIRDSTGAGVTIQSDQPITRLNVFSIDKVQSVEPYIAIDLAPGEEKRWAYRYTFAR